LIRINSNFYFFFNINEIKGQVAEKPLFEKYGDSLSVILFQDNDLIKASTFVNKIDQKIKKKSHSGLGVYYYYKSLFLKQSKNHSDYLIFLNKSLKQLDSTEGYFVYKILVNEQLSRLYNYQKDFLQEFKYLKIAFNLVKKHHKEIPITVSDLVLKPYFMCLFNNGYVEQAMSDYEWIDILSESDNTKVVCLFNLSYMLSQKGASRDNLIINKKLYSFVIKSKMKKDFLIMAISSYSGALFEAGHFEESNLIFKNNIDEIEMNFNDFSKVDFYFRYANNLNFDYRNSRELESIIKTIEENRFNSILTNNEKYKSNLKDLKKQTLPSAKILKIEKSISYLKNIETIFSQNILIGEYNDIISLYIEVGFFDKAKKSYSSLLEIFNKNKKTLSIGQLSTVYRVAKDFEDIEIAKESLILLVDKTNSSICLNTDFTPEDFKKSIEYYKKDIFIASAFNLKYGNFPELNEKIIYFHELLKDRISQEIIFNQNFKKLKSSNKYSVEILEFDKLRSLLNLSIKQRERFNYLKTYFTEVINSSSNQTCNKFDINNYKKKNKTILYYTSLEIDNAIFYRLYTLNSKTNLKPFGFYSELADSEKINYSDKEFIKEHLNNLQELDLDGSEEIIISRASDINFINFSAYFEEINKLTGNDTRIRLVNTLNEIDNIKNDKFLKTTKVFIYGDIDFDNSINNNNEDGFIVSTDATNLNLNINRSLINSWSYLPGTKKEIELIEKQAVSNNVNFSSIIGANANEISIRQLSNNSSPFVLHLATHGFFFSKNSDTSVNSVYNSENDPFIRSGLILAGANKIWKKESNIISDNDGILTSKEISSLDLQNCKLVVLSACDTGLGNFATDNVVGLQKAFKMAGVDKIIMSLSKVSDEKAPIFFDYFYSELFSGLTIHKAFSNTQKEMRKRYGFEDDFWASFILLE
jgi:hypothetical protein